MKIKKLKKLKKYYLEETPTKLSWPMSAKSNKKFFFIQKEKKITMAHECQIWNFYQALYITK